MTIGKETTDKNREFIVGNGVRITEDPSGIYIYYKSISGHNSSRFLGNSAYIAGYRWARELLDSNDESKVL